MHQDEFELKYYSLEEKKRDIDLAIISLRAEFIDDNINFKTVSLKDLLEIEDAFPYCCNYFNSQLNLQNLTVKGSFTDTKQFIVQFNGFPSIEEIESALVNIKLTSCFYSIFGKHVKAIKICDLNRTEEYWLVHDVDKLAYTVFTIDTSGGYTVNCTSFDLDFVLKFINSSL